jgi:hypothetical protein
MWLSGVMARFSEVLWEPASWLLHEIINAFKTVLCRPVYSLAFK